MGMKPSIEVHIEELVLEGLTADDGVRMRSALERELANLVSHDARPPVASATGHTTIETDATQTLPVAEVAGRRIAQLVYGRRK